jgi:rhamnosyltransferase
MTFEFSLPPSVGILLATRNGAAWLGEQLSSLADQRDVRVHVVASDDASTDETPRILSKGVPELALQQLPTPPHRMGNANRNFLRLIRDTPTEDFQYFALSDQDDIWLPNKLSRSIRELERVGADAYSTNVTAFWSDGTERLVVKSGRQRRYDHLFESAGPGCTFVFRREAFLRLQSWVISRFETLQGVRVHDWLIYAYARHQGWHWHIDNKSCMRYRQHGSNEIGVNIGLQATLARWRQVRSGKYLADVLAIAEAVEDNSIITHALHHLTPLTRLRLIADARQCRRNGREALLLGLFFLMFPAHPPTRTNGA